MQHVILCSGKAERLGGVSKCSIEIAGSSLLEKQVRSIRLADPEAEIIAVMNDRKGDFAYKIAERLKLIPVFGKNQMGNIYDLKLVKRLHLLNSPYMILFGDTMTGTWFDDDLAQVMWTSENTSCDYVALVRPTEHPLDSNLVEVGTPYIKKIYEKIRSSFLPCRNLAMAGVFAFKSTVELVGRDIVEDTLLPGKYFGCPVVATTRMMDVGTPSRLSAASHYKYWTSGFRGLVCLDRDDTIITLPQSEYIKHEIEVELLPGAADAIKLLREQGFAVVCITNQPRIQLGKLSHEKLDLIHKELERLLGEYDTCLDAIYYCPHYSEGLSECECRKPNPGMINQAKKQFRIEKNVWVVGDSIVDVEAGKNAKVKTIQIPTGKFPISTNPDFFASDVLDAANIIIANG